MANRFTEKKSLIDCIAPPNELLNIRAIPGGHRYRFSGRVLPDWFKKKAKSVDCARRGDQPNHGRSVHQDCAKKLIL